MAGVARQVSARHGLACPGIAVTAGPGEERFGGARQGSLGVAGPGPVCHSMARWARQSWHGLVGWGTVQYGKASQSWRGWVCRSTARHGSQGEAGQGAVRMAG